jgi:hypothetical protein
LRKSREITIPASVRLAQLEKNFVEEDRFCVAIPFWLCAGQRGFDANPIRLSGVHPHHLPFWFCAKAVHCLLFTGAKRLLRWDMAIFWNLKRAGGAEAGDDQISMLGEDRTTTIRSNRNRGVLPSLPNRPA